MQKRLLTVHRPMLQIRTVCHAALVFAVSAGVPFLTGPAAFAQNTKKPASKPPSVPAKESRKPAATNTAQTLRVLYSGKPLSVPSSSAQPYRDPSDNEICIAPESLEGLGIVIERDEEEKENIVRLRGPFGGATAELRRPPADSPSARYSGGYIPVVDAVTALGGKCEFDAETNTLHIRSVLQAVEMLGGQLRIKTSLPVLPVIRREDATEKIIIDFPGTELGEIPKTLDLSAPYLKEARAGQFQPDIARIVLELNQPLSYIVLGGKSSTALVLNPIPVPGTVIARKNTPVANPTAQNPKPVARKGPKPSEIATVELRAINDSRVQFVVRSTRATDIRTYQNSDRLVLEMNDTVLGPKATERLAGATHPFVQNILVTGSEENVARLALDLTRIVTFTVKPDGSGNIVMDLYLPKNAGGRLEGKLIVVDAGHGAHDRGARGVNGSFEKDVNLAIAGSLTEQLRQAGANVIMTRSNDHFIKVNDRPRIANRAGADFFISVHANDPGNGNRKINGSVVYYHGKDQNCRALAQCIANRFDEMGGIRAQGVKSDYTIYPGNGFGVLRNSRMVAVLVETGFMTNPNDVRYLNDPVYQAKIAAAIATGLRDYIEGNPEQDTRNNNPKADPGAVNLLLDTTTPAVMPEE
ncbi:MAG: hypothetical protein OHK0029_00330 [Armatimonadaceae bacterium]